MSLQCIAKGVDVEQPPLRARAPNLARAAARHRQRKLHCIVELGGELNLRRPPADGRPRPTLARRHPPKLPSVGVMLGFTVATRMQLTSTSAVVEFDTFRLTAVFGLLDRLLASNVAANRRAEGGEADCSASG